MATGKLQITTRGDRELVMIRSFNAPRNLVFETLTKPELIRKWLLGPPGWTMPVCEIDLRVGGSYRYLWRHAAGQEMGMGGIYREIAPPERLVATEKFDQSWYPGGAIVSFALTEQAGKTTLTQTVQYDSPEALQAVLKSPMEGGVTAGYDRLEELITSMTAGITEKGAR
jgi:uncharacterized protein YndB with AHSA1/START domain